MPGVFSNHLQMDQIHAPLLLLPFLCNPPCPSVMGTQQVCWHQQPALSQPVTHCLMLARSILFPVVSSGVYQASFSNTPHPTPCSVSCTMARARLLSCSSQTPLPHFGQQSYLEGPHSPVSPHTPQSSQSELGLRASTPPQENPKSCL